MSGGVSGDVQCQGAFTQAGPSRQDNQVRSLETSQELVQVCEACGRPFAWRKKWARDWDNVKTCSERCKGDLRHKNRAG